jgi:two-component system response regulator MprA
LTCTQSLHHHASRGTIDTVDDAAVLLVEDDAALRASVARGLREHGLQVTTAVDGASALATAGSGPGTRFDAVVLDIGLPDSDGRDVCHALRARGIDIPVVFLTAKDQLADVLAAFPQGATITSPSRSTSVSSSRGCAR